ncbi:MAG: hypothetical protein ABS897_04145 [Eubacteriales bacterium]
MKKRNTMIRLLAAALALALFPFAAQASGENTLESAPEVAMQAETPAEETEPSWGGMDEPVTADSFWSAYAYIPERYGVDYKWLEESGYQDEFYIDPYLTLEEYKRVLELKAEVEAGEKSLADISYPAAPDELKIAVYPLDPGEFNGETYYVTLPSRKLKDYDLLYLLSCFEQAGIPFEPEELCSRNCMRGYIDNGGTRKLAPEEQERMAALLKQVAKGTLTEADIDPETKCASVSTWFGPLCFYPYRRMTDDELAAFALVRESRWDDDPDDVERKARDFAGTLLDLPMSMKLAESWRSTVPYSDTTDGYGMTFRLGATDENGKVKEEKGEPCEVYAWLRKRRDNGGLVADTLEVQFYSWYGSFFTRAEGEQKTRDEMMEIGTKWLKEHVKILNDKYEFKYEDEFGYYRIWAEGDHWYFFVEMSRDGFIYRFSAQLLV